MKNAFALWLTGLPASGKSTITKVLVRQLAKRGVKAAVLESDALRKIFTPQPQYTEDERVFFYSAMVYVGALLTAHGVPVIFDATANRRAYRDPARKRIPRFLEIYVNTPLSVCIGRDPKGIYKMGNEGAAATVPGLQSKYEPPSHSDLVIDGKRETPESAAARIIAALEEKGFLPKQRV